MSHHKRELIEQGYTVVPDIVPVDDCRRIGDSLLTTAATYGHLFEAPENIGYIPSVINYDQSFAHYLAHAELLGLVESLLGPNVRISFTSATINHPGNARLHWHADWPFNQRNGTHIVAPYPDQVMHLTTLWMFSAFSADNGGTLLVPGSHRRGTNPTVQGSVTTTFPDETQAEGEQGSVLVMDSRMWHATESNRTDQPRVSLAVRYAPWWLNLEVLRPGKQQDSIPIAAGASHNHVPTITQEAFESLPAEVKPLYAHWVE